MAKEAVFFDAGKQKIHHGPQVLSDSFEFIGAI